MFDDPQPRAHEDPDRWRRRAMTVPVVLVVAVAAFVVTPLVLPALLAADVARARLRLPATRVWLVGLRYLFNETVEVLTAPLIWLVAKPGDVLGRRTTQRLSGLLAMWSARSLARSARRLLGVTLEVEGNLPPRPADRPLVIVARHASLLDAALPPLVVADADPTYRTANVSGVLMSELLIDPGFDIVYNRMGSVFVDRNDAPAARAAIRSMSSALPAGAVAVIFCEGRLFSPERLAARLERIRKVDRIRAERLEGLESVLPPKVGGLFELLAGSPNADVVIVEHSGLESVPSVSDLLRRAPIGHPARVRMRYFERESLPVGEEGLAHWLDDQYLEMDHWVSERVANPVR